MPPITYESVVELLREMHASSHDRITMDTRLREDLGMDGDDAIEFFSALAERFSVDLSTLECHRFFRGEADISSPFSWIAGWIAPERNARIPVSVRHLVTVVEDGRWHDPTPAAV